MKREIYTYGASMAGISPASLRARLPIGLQGQLQSPTAIHVDASQASLINEVDRVLDVGKSSGVIRCLHAEVDRSGLNEYERYFADFECVDGNPKRPGPIDVQTTAEFLEAVDYVWPEGLALGIRELWNPCHLRILLVSNRVKDSLQAAEITGIRFVRTTQGQWSMEFARRVRCVAEGIVPHFGFDPVKRLVTGFYSFGQEYLSSDFGPEDLQLIDRLEIGKEVYRYNKPWIVASRRFFETCVAQGVNGLSSACRFFDDGFVAVLVGRGKITSSLPTNVRRGRS
jgi:hypothetical protein